MKRRKIFSLLLILTLLMSGCGSQKSEESISENSDTQSTEEESSNSNVSVIDMFTDRDYRTDYDEANSVIIELNGNFASCDSNTVEISGSTVTIKDEGTYILRGTLDDGMIIVDVDEKDKPQLVFDGVDINSETSAPLYILEGDKVFVTLAEGSENILSNGGTFEAIDDNNIDGAIFSKQDLTLNGNGTLTINSPAGHGIVCKDDLVFTSGTYVVNSASHGLDANDSVRCTNATITVSAGKDAIHAENSDDTSLGFIYVANGTYNLSGEGDGMDAGAYILIDDGTFDIISGGGSENATKQTSDSWGGFMGGRGENRPGEMTKPGTQSQSTKEQSIDTAEDSEDSSTSIKGVKATGDLTINGGTFTIDTADDAVHSNANATINGGTFEIAAGDDGVHADETLTIIDTNMNISESYEGLEALHIEVSGGNISLVASDDGLNAAGGTDRSGMTGPRGQDQFGGGSSSNGSILISGGTLYINASGDGLDANGTLEISGGITTVCGPTQGDTATLDYDVSGVITGGTFVGTGASSMAQTFSDSEQGVIAVSVGNQAAGTEITLTDSQGNVVITHAPELSFGVVILSSPDIVKGETYTITVGAASGEFEAS